jgi:hypothetical protein
MVLEYTIVGGCLKIQKNVFIQEMLSKDSKLRSLLNWKTTGDFSIRHPLVSEPDGDNIISINFDSDSGVTTGEPPKELLSTLKAKYRDKIKGRVACRVVYSAFGGIFTYQVDLNSDSAEAEYLT